MHVQQSRWTPTSGWEPILTLHEGKTAQWVLVFGSSSTLRNPESTQTLRAAYPNALISGCSTAGEILDTQVTDESLVATAIYFDHTTVKGQAIQLEQGKSSFVIGQELGQLLDPEGLVHVFVLSDGLAVNGSELVNGLAQALPKGVTLTGGLSGDGDRFQETWTLWDGATERNRVVAIGLYGDRLRVGYGSWGGWTPFGPERVITESQGNVLYKLDGQSALQLYKTYLGDHVDALPAAGLLFPLSLRTQIDDRRLVRTILSISEADQSLTFAGDMPEGTMAQLMHASFDRLVDGAIEAAETSYEAIGSTAPTLAILISCVGRKLLLKQRIEEEVEGVREVLGSQTAITGFYSYGEISPFAPGATCELHNQTMTITTLLEV
ncbi:MAG: FIST N-terminal domain-containing protein [Leptolyngbyaceae cyanobacterium bins.59]|nr:FIST N-terminal domain-containing protein [Leptolyngbyaceae cyanobacterium bins.59]